MPRLLLTVSMALALGCGPGLAHESPADQAAHYSHLLAAEPGNPDLHLQRAELHRLAGQWTAAANELALAAESGADPAVVSLCRAALELDRGNPQAALDALALVPGTSHDALRVRGRALRQLGRLPDAAAALARAVAGSAHPRPDDYLELAAVTAAQGEAFVPEALARLDAGLVRLGPVASLILAAVDLEVRAHRHDEALARLATAPAPLAATPQWLARQGEILQQAGRQLEAEAAFTAAIARIEELPAHRRRTPAVDRLASRLRAELGPPDPIPTGTQP